MKENKMGIMPIKKLVLNMSLPAILAMSVQALYNIVDSIFIGMDSQAGLTAVSLAFPIQMIIVALSVGIGIGINSCVSRNLGAKNFDAAHYTAQHGIVLTLSLFSILFLLGLFAVDLYIPLFSTDQAVISAGIDYTKIILLFAIFQMLAQSIISILQGTGDMVASMRVQLTGAIVNCILDPVLIFGLFSFPALGAKGAALATVFGQFCSFLVAYYLILKKKDVIDISLRSFSFDKTILKNIIQIGLPSAVMQSIGSVMVTGMNLILAQFGDHAITVLGIYFKLQSFAFMPCFGLNQGVLPILSYNYGAQNKTRFVETIRFALTLAFGYTMLACIIFQLFPSSLMRIFSAEGEVLEIGINALHILSIAFPFAGIAIALSSTFQALSKAKVTMISSILRQLFLLLPLAFILFNLFGVYFGWLAFPISELLAFIYILYQFKKVKRDIINHM